MIKHAAGASAAMLTTGEAAAQSRSANLRVIVTKATKQVWKYKFVPARPDAVEQAGREMWEAVCMFPTDHVLCKPGLMERALTRSIPTTLICEGQCVTPRGRGRLAG